MGNIELYRMYVRELGEYDVDLKGMGDEEIDSWCSDFVNDDNSDWLDVYSADGQRVGFVIISRYPSESCHPDANYYISQTYIMKQYRDRGLVSRVIRKYLSEHKGVYGFDTLEGNKTAEEFWSHIFDGYKYIDLPEVRSKDISYNLNLHGYLVC